MWRKSIAPRHKPSGTPTVQSKTQCPDWTYFKGIGTIASMSLTATNAKSALIRHRQIDSWFISKAHLNLYRGCRHNCIYCDGRYESYHVEGDFGSDIVARQNIPDLLDAALNPHRKRKPLNSGFIMLGGGVSDSYQPAEKKLQIAKRCLEIILKWRKPVHILTKSTLVERDLGLLKDIQQVSAALVSVSFSTVNDQIARVCEPGCPSPSRRLEMMARLVDNGLPVGMFLMPVIPGISDTHSEISQSVAAAVDIGASFVIFGGMTLKPGRQMSHFYDALRSWQPEILQKYARIYKGDAYGAAVPKYYQRIEKRFTESARDHRVHRRIPPSIFGTICSDTDRLRIVLAHLDYLQGACGDRHPFRQLQKWLREAGETPDLFAFSSLPHEHRILIQDLLSNDGRNLYDKYL